MILRHRLERGPRLHGVANDLVYVLMNPKAVLPEIRQLAQVFIVECRARAHIDDNPSRSEKGQFPNSTRKLRDRHAELQDTYGMSTLRRARLNSKRDVVTSAVADALHSSCFWIKLYLPDSMPHLDRQRSLRKMHVGTCGRYSFEHHKSASEFARTPRKSPSNVCRSKSEAHKGVIKTIASNGESLPEAIRLLR